ncbi:MAG: type IX secretion system sortase PorU [Candidatus Neomarinimicrobiota bacterium]|nr:type IX secretion system sortase PorU [Candidatus Neomarinimicrobiota bacterium]MDX9780037.1 type IX secretion system sortase PorU [bacterium]
MKKPMRILSLLLPAALAFASAGIHISYPDQKRIVLEISTGNFETFQWYEDGQLFERHAFDHSNNIRWDGNTAYEILQIPIAIADRIPALRVQVLETEDLPHSCEGSPLYTLSDPHQFRERAFVYLTLNPFLPGNTVARRFRVEADLYTAAGKGISDPSLRFFVNQSYAEGLDSPGGLRTLSGLRKTQDFQGTWLDLRVREEGIYSIRISDLQAAGLSESLSDERVYLFAGRTFGAPLRDTFPDSADFHLKEVPLLFLDAQNDADDQWVFYASGNSAWERMSSKTDLRATAFIRNPYESDQHFRLFIGSNGRLPLRMSQELPQFSGTETEIDHTYQRIHDESEGFNPGKGGELWLGERIIGNLNRAFYLNNLSGGTDLSAALRLGFGVATAGAHEFKAYLADSLIYQTALSTAKNSDDYDYESSITRRTQMNLAVSALGEETRLRFTYSGEYAGSEGFLDYIDVIYPVYPQAINGYLRLWYPPQSAARKVHVEGLAAGLSYVFSVEDPFAVSYYPVSGTFTDIRIPEGNSGNSYVVLNEGHFKTPLSLQLLPDFNPRNHADHERQIDFVIITPDLFLAEAQRLAVHKESRFIQPLNTLVKSYSEIIGQFNAGNRDPFAIRHFLANLYAQAPAPKPLYVLLLGDGHYDYQNRISSDPVYIPHVYESGVLWPCDDILVMLNSVEDLTNDMAVGRVPANSLDDVRAVVDKIIEYDLRKNPGEWQLNAMLVADDPTDLAQGPSFIGQTVFIRDSERLHNLYLPKVLQTKKLYLTEYPERYISELQTMGRDGAREDLMTSLLNGQAFVNFYGHGDASVWTQENVFVKNDLQRLEVNRQYPVILAATCSWGRSDIPGFQSSAEEIVTLPANGAISTIATVRSVFHGSSGSANVKFVEDFCTALFDGNPDFAYSPLLGDAMLYAKNRSNNLSGVSKVNNNMKFMYFGDPTLVPAFPRHAGSIDSLSSDTLRALDQISISGTAFQRDSSAAPAGELEGRITVYDNRYLVSREYVNNIYGNTTSISYYLEGNRLFNGNIAFTGDRFETRAFIPKDIQYRGDRGKVRLLYHNADGSFDGSAVIDTVHIGGINPDAAQDVNGPMITLRSGGRDLQNGAVLFDTSRVRIEFQDDSGINITGTAGHVLEMRINNGMQVLDLSGLFVYEQNDFSRGSVEFPVHLYLDEGTHFLEISAFDNYNNYAQTEVSVTVLTGAAAYVQDLVNYPNPFSVRTDFTFTAAVDASATLQIYSLSGKPVARMEDIPVRRGFNAVPWEARDDHGYPLAAGVYFYVLRIREDETVYRYQNKMLILP